MTARQKSNCNDIFLIRVRCNKTSNNFRNANGKKGEFKRCRSASDFSATKYMHVLNLSMWPSYICLFDSARFCKRYKMVLSFSHKINPLNCNVCCICCAKCLAISLRDAHLKCTIAKHCASLILSIMRIVRVR